MKQKLAIALISLGLTSMSALSSEKDAFDSYSKPYKECMDKAVSTLDMIECNNSEYSVQDKRLNIAYRALRSKQTPARVTQLTELQKIWIKYRDANCAFYYDPDGGSLARIMANDCMLTMTKDRAAEFESMLKN
jgi:uncharacterized protein YecT (DUF1311 family)